MPWGYKESILVQEYIKGHFLLTYVKKSVSYSVFLNPKCDHLKHAE